MNKFEAITVAAIVGLAEIVALALFGASAFIWLLVLTGSI